MNEFKHIDVTKYVGDLRQLFGITQFKYFDGKAKDTHAIEIKTGNGLRYIVIPDRGMDIGYAEYNGKSIAYISPVGVVSPEYFDARGDEWLRSFGSGLLTTCGLDQVGVQCSVDGIEYPLHGRISNIPAESVCAKTTRLADGSYQMQVSGLMRQAKQGIQNITLTRTITSYSDSNCIDIKDVIQNEGFIDTPFMILYHINFGFPFLNKEFHLEIPYSEISSMYDNREDEIKNAFFAEEPKLGYSENVFLTKLIPDDFGNCVINVKPSDNMKHYMMITVPVKELPYAVLWKQMGYQDYIMSIEPCNNFSCGQLYEKEKNTLQILGPRESRTINIRVEIKDNEE